MYSYICAVFILPSRHSDAHAIGIQFVSRLFSMHKGDILVSIRFTPLCSCSFYCTTHTFLCPCYLYPLSINAVFIVPSRYSCAHAIVSFIYFCSFHCSKQASLHPCYSHSHCIYDVFIVPNRHFCVHTIFYI